MGSKSAIGIGNGICFKQVRDKGGGSYIDPLVRDSIVGLWKFDQNTNESSTRNIIKNTIKGKGGDLELLNFAYKANSGYNGYPEDFTSWGSSNAEVSKGGNKAKNTKVDFNLLYTYSDIKRDVGPFKVKISNFTKGIIRYWYRQEDGIETILLLEPITVNNSNGLIELPKSYNTVENGTGFRGGFTGNDTNIGVTIEQLPLYEGALVTDGKDDMIVSQKTVQEMLGGSKEITVVSMIHQIGRLATNTNLFTNCIWANTGSKGCNIVNYQTSLGKTGIYGYYRANVSVANNEVVINNILGDKADYLTNVSIGALTSNEKFSVVGYLDVSPQQVTSVAVYWTFIANKVLTTDEINQIIAYFKLDKYVTPQVIYDVKKQGLTNDTPAADWYLKDFSGNGHDMQLYNYGKTPESGINEEGGLQSDGVLDYGQFVGDLGLKDYTVVVDRAYPSLKGNGVPVISNIKSDTVTPFLFEFADNTSVVRPYSFGATTVLSPMELSRKISYQSTYIYDGTAINKGLHDNTGNGLTIGRFGIDTQYANIALWSLLLFPYTLSEFLLERQLKKYKLGTLYPGMIEWRPKVNINVPVVTPPTFSINNGSDIITDGQYIPEDTEITIRIFTATDGSVEGINEATAKINGVDIELTPSGNKTYYGGKFIISSKQKIDITIDEYIRYEDIVQPYPTMPNILVNGKYVTWGDKLKVGDEFRYMGNTNLLSDIYTFAGAIRFNGNQINYGSYGIISKNMVFTIINKTWLLDTTEPHAIYSPQKLNIPNSSLKILGYVPDLTGKGNHGKLNNFAYTEDSGVSADGSIKFDGTDDHITIPTLAHGGKCVMMKVNLQKYDTYLYDQRNNWEPYLAIVSAGNTIAYSYSNQGGKTYIDGILNEHIIDKDLIGITHNITVGNSGNAKSYSPNIGTSFAKGNFTNMSLYEFMLFPEIPSEDEIKKLNDVMGVEGGYVESPNYYWDAYGKKNTDTDRNLIADQVSKDVANALEVKNVAYNSESGYGGKSFIVKFNKVFSDGNWNFINERVTFEVLDDGNSVRITETKSRVALFWTGAYNKKAWYKVSGVSTGKGIKFGNDVSDVYSVIAETDGIYEVDWSLNLNASGSITSCCILTNGWTGECNIVIEQLTEYPNGLVLDGVEDHAVNTVIPAVTDFTVIAKREFLDNTLSNNETFLLKGDKVYSGNVRNGFVMEYFYGTSNYLLSFGHPNILPLETSKISLATPTSYNGTTVTKGTGGDNPGIIVGKYSDVYWHGVFYKMMLYTKTIDQLSINMLKNLFERDELIDVTNPIFKKEEL